MVLILSMAEWITSHTERCSNGTKELHGNRALYVVQRYKGKYTVTGPFMWYSGAIQRKYTVTGPFMWYSGTKEIYSNWALYVVQWYKGALQ